MKTELKSKQKVERKIWLHVYRLYSFGYIFKFSMTCLLQEQMSVGFFVLFPLLRIVVSRILKLNYIKWTILVKINTNWKKTYQNSLNLKILLNIKNKIEKFEQTFSRETAKLITRFFPLLSCFLLYYFWKNGFLSDSKWKLLQVFCSEQ